MSDDFQKSYEEAKRTAEGDIVERLLRMVPMYILGGKPMLLNPDGPAAVNEIDQLRNEIINLRAGASVMQEELNNQEDLNDSWREENEGLRAEIEALQAKVCKLKDDLVLTRSMLPPGYTYEIFRMEKSDE